jgi:hypothetical protein
MENIIKEGNVLGAGPSRISYIPNHLPSIGCNFPYAKVNWIMTIEEVVILKWLEDPSIFDPEAKFIINQNVYSYLKRENILNKVKHKIHSIYKIHNISSIEFTGSSGHYAAEWLISQGFNKLNLYGMDNYFGDTLCENNYSHQPNTSYYMSSRSKEFYTPEQLIQRGKEWQTSWQRIIKYNPNVEFNFVR